MRTLWAVLVSSLIGVLFVGTAAIAEDENSPKTSGLSAIGWVQGSEVIDSQTWYYYEWTLYNMTGKPLGDALVDCNGKQYQVLIDKLSITKLLPAPDLDPVAPDGWIYKANSEQFERYWVEDMSDKKYAPPSVAPGGSISGFRFYYLNLPLPALTNTQYVTHVLAVDPSSATWYPDHGEEGAWGYTSTTVCLPGYGDNNETWWDGPGSPPDMPEATTMALGISGLGTLAALRRLRK